MEIVKYRGKCYTAVRPIDKPDERLLTVEKQAVAKEMFNKGVSSAEIAEVLNVDEDTLNVWWDNETRIDSISEANRIFAEGKAKLVEVINLDTGNSTIFPSLSSAGRYVGTTAATVKRDLLLKKKYKHYMFRYAD